MENELFRRVPLTEREKQQLLLIYRTRLRLFLSAYATLILMAISSLGRIDILHWNHKLRSDHFVTNGQAALLALACMMCLLLLPGFFIFRKRIWTFKRDADAGWKECIPYLVTMKQYFDLTNQYFLSFNDPAYMHRQVTSEQYSACNEGDTVTIYRAPASKYVFEENDRFTLM